MAVDPVATYNLHAEPTGQGILDAMTAAGDEPSWVYSYGGEEFAMSMGKSGALYIYDAVSEKVRSFQPRPA